MKTWHFGTVFDDGFYYASIIYDEKAWHKYSPIGESYSELLEDVLMVSEECRKFLYVWDGEKLYQSFCPSCGKPGIYSYPCKQCSM